MSSARPITPRSLAAINDPAVWLAESSRRRGLVVGGLLGCAIIVRLAGYAVDPWLFVGLTGYWASMRMAAVVIGRFESPAARDAGLALSLALGTVMLAGTAYVVGGPYFGGVAGLLVHTSLINTSLPRRTAWFITGVAVLANATGLVLEWGGWWGSRAPFGVMPYTANTGMLLVALATGSVLLLFTAYSQQHFGRTVRANEERLRATEAAYRAALDSIQEVVFQVDADDRWRFLSSAWRGLTGTAPGDALGGAVLDDLHPEDAVRWRALRAATADGVATTRRQVLRVRGQAGWRRVEVHAQALAEPAGTLAGALRDVSEQERLEDQLRQTQKMEAVGRLAGGVAHDFNNVLQAVRMNVEMAESALPADADLHTELREIRTAAERAAALTRQLLTFSRRQRLEPEPLDLARVVDGVEPLLRRIAGEDLRFVVGHLARDPWVLADRSQLEQVIVNLVVNARDAMPDGGVVVLETAIADGESGLGVMRVGDPPRTARRVIGHEGPDGPRAVLRVRDTGTGIADDVLPHLFEPFFSTKPRTERSGLGLATVYGIVQQSGGAIRVGTTPGQGTTFEILLPLTRPPADAAPPADAVRLTSETPIPAPGDCTVLLAEDEAPVRLAVRRVLERLGYRVLEAIDGADALVQLRSHRGQVDVLVTDVVMPEMGGRELVRRVAQEFPAVATLFVSGYTAHEAGHGASELDGRPLVRKPFSAAELSVALRGVLAGRR
ncbi:MAG: ATP-binding protein [Gemmatimonadaceae bacterium]|jgi:PAS domain S-box-containing protein|nr:ATP-binding protein [Gemmatimonadaceae bacterium]